MELTFIEATNGPQNWGKFMVARFDKEWQQRSAIFEPTKLSQVSLLRSQGWSPQHIIVFDLATGEGAFFLPHKIASPSVDLEKHRIWVCPLFQPFLTWLYKQDLTNLQLLPSHIDLPDAEFSMHGYRRKGRGNA